MDNDTTGGDAAQHGQQGAGATQSGGNPARSSGDDAPITKKDLKSLLGELGKSLDKRVNRAVSAHLRRKPTQPPAQSDADDDGDLDDADLDDHDTDTQDGDDGESSNDRTPPKKKQAQKPPAKSKEAKRIADLERKLAERDAKDAEKAKKVRNAELVALLASKAGKPKLVAKLLEAELEVGEDGQFLAKDADGEEIELEEYVETFLRENPEFVKRGKSEGADVVPDANGGSGEQKFDFDNPSAEGLNAILRARARK